MKVSSDIMSLTPYRPGKPISEAKRELGLEQIIKLASNENPLGPNPLVLKAIQEASLEIHRYPDAANFELLEVYSNLIHVSKEQIAVGNGSNELIDLLIRIYCEPGEAILTSQAAFIAYKIGAQAARVKTIETPLNLKGGFDLKAMAHALQANGQIRLVFIANPNNPTGTLIPRDELTAFLDLASQKDVLVILDEAYTEFVRDPQFISGLELRKRYNNLVILRTLSKAYGLAGLRLGFAIAEPQVIDLINRVRNPFNINILAQAAGIVALQDQAYVQRVCEITWHGLDSWVKAIKGWNKPFFKSEGNFILMDCQMDSDLVFNHLLKKGVILRPVKNYGLMSQIRISIGTEQENKMAIHFMNAFWESYSK